MRKFLILGIGVFFFSTALAYSASWSLTTPPSHVDRLQSEMTRQLVIHPEFKNISWRIGIKRLRDQPAGGTITFFEDGSVSALVGHKMSTFAVRKFMAHEFGHYVFYDELDDQQREAYCRLFEYFGESVSDSGRQNCVENFADGYAIIHYNARWSHAPTYGYYGVYQNARPYFLETRQGEFINNLK